MGVMLTQQSIIKLQHFTGFDLVAFFFKASNYLARDFIFQTIWFEEYEGSLHKYKFPKKKEGSKGKGKLGFLLVRLVFRRSA